jgi:hypothetical protein
MIEEKDITRPIVWVEEDIITRESGRIAIRRRVHINADFSFENMISPEVRQLIKEASSRK